MMLAVLQVLDSSVHGSDHVTQLGIRVLKLVEISATHVEAVHGLVVLTSRHLGAVATDGESLMLGGDRNRNSLEILQKPLELGRGPRGDTSLAIGKHRLHVFAAARIRDVRSRGTEAVSKGSRLLVARESDRSRVARSRDCGDALNDREGTIRGVRGGVGSIKHRVLSIASIITARIVVRSVLVSRLLDLLGVLKASHLRVIVDSSLAALRRLVYEETTS